MNDQASRSCDTFADEVTDPGALVLAKSASGYGHCPEGVADPGKVVVAGMAVLPPAPAAASMVSEAIRAAGKASVVVLTRMGLIGAIILTLSLGLNALFIRMWRRPPYRYEAEYRKPWDDAASLARARADRAAKASIFARRAAS